MEEQPPESAPRAARAPAEGEISLLRFLTVVLRRRGTVVTMTGLAGAIALVVALVARAPYTATVSFMPQGNEPSTSGLAGLAGQFGIQLPQQNSGESPQFYAALVASRKMLAALVDGEYAFEVPSEENRVDTLSGALPELLELGKPDEAWPLRREEAIRWLADEALSVSVNEEAGIVAVRLTTPWAGLSHALAESLLANVNQFNLETRRSHAAAERTFVSSQLAEAQDSLRRAENRLESFLVDNRQYASSPVLTFQHDRLQRQVTMRQQLYTSLAESYDAARIAEVRNTPVITVLEAPELPVRPDPMWLVLKLVLGLGLGWMLGLLLAFVREASERGRQGREPEYEELSTLWAQAWAEVRSLGRRRP